MPKKQSKFDKIDEAEDANKEHAASGGDELESIAENAGRYARRFLDEAGDMDHAGAFVAAIREKPVQSALIALGLGAVIGMLLKRQ
jgi:ElaB/YqjD/DUF883 family membrane-anchored ribosome-binding protein